MFCKPDEKIVKYIQITRDKLENKNKMTQHKHDKKYTSKPYFYSAAFLAGMTIAITGTIGVQHVKADIQTGILPNSYASVKETLAVAAIDTASTASSVSSSIAVSSQIITSSSVATITLAQSDISSTSNMSIISSLTSTLSIANTSISSASTAVTSASAALASASTAASNDDATLTSLSNQLNNLSAVATQNLASYGFFPSTSFSASETVVLPIPSEAFVPDSSEINSYFITYVNELRSLNGQPALSYSAIEQSFAQLRAQQIQSDFSHDLSNGSTEDIATNGGIIDSMLSDAEIAYYMVMDWYDESDNPESLGDGHYGHLANLLYGGPTAGIGFIKLSEPVNVLGQSGFDVFIAFEAPPYTSTTLYNKAITLANSTTNPSVIPLPNITFKYVNATSYNSLTAEITSLSSTKDSDIAAMSSASSALTNAQSILTDAQTTATIISAELTEAQNSETISSPIINNTPPMIFSTSAVIYSTQSYRPNLNFMTATDSEGNNITLNSGVSYTIMDSSGAAANLSVAGYYTVTFSYTDPTSGLTGTSSSTLQVVKDATSLGLAY